MCAYVYVRACVHVYVCVCVLVRTLQIGVHHSNLYSGGYFMGTVPDAARVLWQMGERGRMNSPMLQLQKDWKVCVCLCVCMWHIGERGRMNSPMLQL